VTDEVNLRVLLRFALSSRVISISMPTVVPAQMSRHQTTPIAGAAHDQARQGRPRLDLGRVVQRQESDGPGPVASVRRYCTLACQSTHTSQKSSRHVLGLTFAKPSSCGPSSRTCTSRAARPTSTAGRVVHLRIGSSFVDTHRRPSTWISAFPPLRKTAVPLGKCGTSTCSDIRSLAHMYRLGSDCDFKRVVEDIMLNSLGILALSDFPHSGTDTAISSQL
jgi:hypothetical protein